MDYRILIIVVLIPAILFSSSLIFAETTGQISVGQNTTPSSGVYGYTVDFCTRSSDCFDYKCFIDFDGTSSGSYSGWCNQTTITKCYHNGVNYAAGTYYCRTNTTYHICNSDGNGTWGSQTSCSGSDTCSADTSSASNPCSTPSSSSSSTSSSSSSSSSNATTT